MYTVLNALAAGSQYLRGIAHAGAGRDTSPVDGGDADQVTGDAGKAARAVHADETVHSHE